MIGGSGHDPCKKLGFSRVVSVLRGSDHLSRVGSGQDVPTRPVRVAKLPDPTRSDL